MRNYHKILTLLLLSPCLACAGTVTNIASQPTNLLSICLVTNVSFVGSNSTVAPAGVRLITPPILSDKDFVAWNVTNHTFVVTPQAAKRMAGNFAIVCCESPFVVVCSGEPVYFGQFESMESSGACSQPVIMTDSILLNCFGGFTKIPEEAWPLLRAQAAGNSPTNLTEQLLAMTNACTNVTLQIELGYPSENFFRGPDPRDDKRIISAVKTLFEKQKKSGNAD